jgi:hypothetical protein
MTRHQKQKLAALIERIQELNKMIEFHESFVAKPDRLAILQYTELRDRSNDELIAFLIQLGVKHIAHAKPQLAKAA